MASAFLIHTATSMPPRDWVSTTAHVVPPKPCSSPCSRDGARVSAGARVRVRVSAAAPVLAR